MKKQKRLLALLAVAGLATATVAAVLPSKGSCTPDDDECTDCPPNCCPTGCR